MEIPAGGKEIHCEGCGYHYTLFPSGVIIGDFHDYVIYHTDLSGRALSIILRNVSSANHFLKLTQPDFLKFKNCGIKTAHELVEFRGTLRRDLGLVSNDKESESQSIIKGAIPDFLKNDTEFFETIVDRLTAKSYQLFVRKYQIDSLEKLMSLRTENLISIKNCGWKKIREIKRLQNTIAEIVRIIQSNNTCISLFEKYDFSILA